MGVVRSGAPTELVLLLQQHANVDTFVETGTYLGDSTAWAADHFRRVITLEGAEHLYRSARERFADLDHVQCMWADSRSAIKQILPTLESPAIFWLDAHWSGGTTFGQDDECPLLDEIELIKSANVPHLLLIDDARLFLAPPPKPHRVDQWPSIDAVVQALSAGRDSYTIVFEDVVIGVPSALRRVLSEYCQERVSEPLAKTLDVQPPALPGRKGWLARMRRSVEKRLHAVNRC